MLSKEKIVSNTKKYFETAEKYGIMPKEFFEFISNDLMIAPLTNQKDMVGCYDGGLIQYLLTTTKYAININESLPENERVDISSIIRVSLLHQIAKAKVFKKLENPYPNQFKVYDYINYETPMTVTERTMYYISKYNLQLTEAEYSAISSFTRNDAQTEYYNSVLGIILKSAASLAVNSIRNIK